MYTKYSLPTTSNKYIYHSLNKKSYISMSVVFIIGNLAMQNYAELGCLQKICKWTDFEAIRVQTTDIFYN